MKSYRLVRRDSRYYAHHSQTWEHISIGPSDAAIALKLIYAKKRGRTDALH